MQDWKLKYENKEKSRNICSTTSSSPMINNFLRQNSKIAVNQRESSFELLRILSQVFIVLYHICYLWQGKEYSCQPFFQAVSTPLHIGVVVFVLLSGYFTIKLSKRPNLGPGLIWLR